MKALPLRVLVVDDDEDDYVLIRDMLGELEGRYYSFEWCATPEEGLRHLRQGGHDVYLVDYLLGGASGLDLIAAVNREGLSRAFIVLTGRGNHAVDEAALAAGASDYLIKGSIDAERLDRSIRYAVDHTRFVDALRESEVRHRLLFDQSPVPLLVFDRASRGILIANEAARQQYGWNRPGLVGQAVETLFASAEQARFLADLESGALLSGQSQMWEHRRADRQPLRVEAIFHQLQHRGSHAVLAYLQDITARHRAEGRLRLFERAIQSTGNGIVITDASAEDMPIVFVNHAFERMTGYTAAEVLGRNCRFLDGHENNEGERARIRQALRDNNECAALLRNVRKDGTVFWNQLHLSPVRDVAGEVSHYIGVQNDVSAQRDTEAKLAHAAIHDSTTGLVRYPVIELLLQEHASDHPGQPFSLIFADIDRFHATNEAMGKEVGDRVIVQLATRLSDVVGDQGQVARYTGDEFVIALPGVDTVGASALAEQLREAVARTIALPSCEVRVTMSLGVASYPQRVADIGELLRRAEASMSRAKQLGRDMVYLYSEQDMHRIEDRRMLGMRLRGAMQQGEFRLEYQPQIRCSDRSVIGFEALLRWHSPELGLVSPDRFIPVAEGLGLMPELGAWVLDRACAQSRLWLDAGMGDFFVAVNVSAQQIQRGNFAEIVTATRERHGLPADRLELELTESALMENIERALSSIRQLSVSGVKIAFDDFGTGYSSLSYLRQFQVDKLKIDKSFVHDLPHDANSVAIASTVIAIGHQLQMQVVAEGVETTEQQQLLVDLGCDALQGYLIGYPMSIDAVEVWLTKSRALA
ncbi:MAG: EAL domain-containing protein [Rhodanobacter sp.]|nr:EAL domain-containing protein [Rhodanobacter sp.]